MIFFHVFSFCVRRYLLVTETEGLC